MTILEQAMAFKKVREDIKDIRNKLIKSTEAINIVPDDQQKYDIILERIKDIIACNSAISQAANALTFTDKTKIAWNPDHAVLRPIKDALGSLESTIQQIDPDTIHVSGEKSLLAAKALTDVLDINLKLSPDNPDIKTKQDGLREKVLSYEAGSGLGSRPK